MKSSRDNKSIGTVSIGMRTDHQNEILKAHKMIQTVYAFAVLVVHVVFYIEIGLSWGHLTLTV